MNGTDLTKRLPFAFSTFKWNQGFAAPQKNSRTTTVKLKSANAATSSTVSSLLKKRQTAHTSDLLWAHVVH